MESKVSYQEFQEDILKTVSRELNLYGKYECSLIQTPKNNALLDGLSIRREGGSAAPVFYLQEPYRQYLDGKPPGRIGQEIAKFYREMDLPDFSREDIGSYETIKDKLRLRLVNKEKNDRYYKQGPYRRQTLGVEILYIELERRQEKSMTVQVTNSMVHNWGIPAQELFRTALENSQNHDKVLFCSMEEMLKDVFPVSPAEKSGPSPMYVLTNERKEYGATAAIYPNVLKQVREQLGKDYYILPSSTHELIILPKTKDMDAKELRSMVRELNESQVSPEEVLGNEVYEFRGATNRVHKSVKEERER